MTPLAYHKSNDLSQPLNPETFQISETTPSFTKRLCRPILNFSSHPLVRVVMGVAFSVFTVLSILQKASVRFIDGENIKATLLSFSIGGFATTALELFCGTSFSDLSLYQMDATLIIALPMLYFAFSQWELNERENLPLYEKLYTTLFAYGGAAAVTETFRIARKRQEDDRLDLSEGNYQDYEEGDQRKILAPLKVEINHLHHPRIGMKLRSLPFMQTTIKGFKNVSCYTPVGVGAITGSLALASYKQPEMCISDMQPYVLGHTAVFLVAMGVSNLAQFHLTHSIKLQQKRSSQDSDMDASPLSLRVKVIFENVAGQTSAIFWSAMFPFSALNYGMPGLDFFFRALVGWGMAWKGTYETKRFVSGFDVASSIAPPDLSADEVINYGRFTECIQKLKVAKRFYNRHFDTILKVIGGGCSLAGSGWFLYNGVADDGLAVKESAYIAAVMLPASFTIKIAIDIIHSKESGKIMNGLKYYTSHNVAILVSPYLFISQYLKITSTALKQEDTTFLYIADGISWASFATSMGVTAASIKELPPIFLILLINSLFYKISQGDK